MAEPTPVDRWSLHATDAYVEPENPEGWTPCPQCSVRPRIWVFDNGRHARCWCAAGPYEPPTVSAESINAYYRRVGSLAGYDNDALCKAWNERCNPE